MNVLVKPAIFLAILAAVALLAGCSRSPAPTTSPLPAASPLGRPTDLPARAQTIAAEARRDLAGRLNVATDAVKVVRVEAVDWPDASLGCPQPGMMYAQVITPGYRLILEVAGRTYTYHASESRVIACDK